MKEWLFQAIGVVWWPLARLWGAFIGAALVLMPLGGRVRAPDARHARMWRRPHGRDPDRLVGYELGYAANPSPSE
jgi:hypothetical protein